MGLGEHGSPEKTLTAQALKAELRQSHQVVGAALKVKAHPKRSRPRNLVLSCPATVLIQPNASSIR